MSTRRLLFRLAGALSLAIAAALAVGCGGSESAEPLTKAEFTRQANAICAKAIAKRDKAMAEAQSKLTKAGKPVSKQDVEGLIERVALPPMEEMSSQLSKLEPPEGDTEAEAVIAEFRKGINQVAEDPARAIVVIGGPFAAVTERADKYGLSDCGDF